jgi:hypothetical protein
MLPENKTEEKAKICSYCIKPISADDMYYTDTVGNGLYHLHMGCAAEIQKQIDEDPQNISKITIKNS